MSNFKKQHAGMVLVLFAISGCLQTRHAFVFDDQMTASFFKEVPAIAKNTLPRRKNIEGVDSVHVYRTTFTEKLVESNNLLEYALINDSSKTATVNYKQFDGYFQHLYLLHLVTKPANHNVMVYFTVKYDADGNCIGFGPSYYGYLDASRNLIKFTAGLKPVKNENSYQLTQTKAATSLLFVARSIKQRLPINIEKIVNDNPNKIGGQKSVVYAVEKIFRDPLALQFYHIESIKLNP